jgi:hypothetical protein
LWPGDALPAGVLQGVLEYCKGYWSNARGTGVLQGVSPRGVDSEAGQAWRVTSRYLRNKPYSGCSSVRGGRGDLQQQLPLPVLLQRALLERLRPMARKGCQHGLGADAAAVSPATGTG